MIINQPKKLNPHKGLLIFIGILGFIFYAVFAYWNHINSPLNSSGDVQAFVVKKGEGVSSIADRLEQDGIIRSSLAFKVSYKLSNSPIVEAGDFKLSPKMSVNEVINAFSRGSIDKWVTLIEGWRVEEMAEEISKKLKVKSEKFIEIAKIYEGYLFPDSYLFNPEASVETVIETLKATFEKKYTEELRQKIRAKGLTEDEGVILASIVEREGRSEKVRTEVAGVLLKRFKLGIKLDADATVQYAKDSIALQNGKLDKFWKPITRADYTEVISPYNTYLNNGLPPTPICNPSVASLTAVANADLNTPYLFYYHDSKGNSYYAKTIEEHNRNVANNR